ncbi:hypothetical protein BCY91_06120 [Pelobium manganitolerans]|uniref:Uncharacterized protein n=1 Tax=Pelobium manganitolerans TaxID=1842495 RepID=A0A419S4V1_9SPHI|nr:hypothetical protein [Pelobium manganitolerans]RKD15097.1 hypothetical protein BCY91_06120 [Pelobium manganitolerans]
MKLKKLIRDLCCAIKVIVHFGREHHATISMMPGIYGKQPLHSDMIAGVDTMLSITPFGSLFKVTRTDYISNIPENEETWLATYGWHSNGHLIEIGGDRYCIFDTGSKSLYLENLTEQGKTTIELFTKNI